MSDPGPAAGLRAAVAGILLPGFAGTELPDWLGSRLREGLAGVCLFGENVSSTAQVRELTGAIRAANPDAVIAIDEEGGDVTRLFYAEGSPYPGNALLGRIDDVELTRSVGREVGELLADVGCTLDFAPDADINSNDANPVIGVRSFGADPDLVARHTVAWVDGIQSVGIGATVKHFPGHGDTAQDSHLALPVVAAPAEVLRERELVPFRAAVAAGARAVMTSHILLPALDEEQPATMSPGILALLRQELGFSGVIVSDALDMQGASGRVGIPAAAVAALAAGCDLLCIGTRNTDEQLGEILDAVLAAVAAGELSPARIHEARGRVLALGGASERSAAAAAAFPDLLRGFDWSADADIPADALLVQLDGELNSAIGVVPWGLTAAGAPGLTVLTPASADSFVADGRPIVIVGKDNHRHAWQRRLIDRLRASTRTLVVDMGWPSSDRRYADVATFGASRAVGAALREALEKGAR